ncbi:unnamed protein product [Thlaspi arvense]|uniref:TIP41-like protein n=1 Tax=Thlaspi arvense TaxID=13288 RepID=A0AAU9SDU8_THLAR|nr:unnamed protein product [Thlaspi arvense]
MESSFIDDAEFWLPPEFLTDEDFLVEKENNGGGIDKSNKDRHGFGLKSGFGSAVKPTGDEENFLAGLTKQMVQSTVEDDFSGGFCGHPAFSSENDTKAWGTTRSRQSTLCGAGIGCNCQNQRLNQNCQTRVSSQAAAWDLYCAAAEELARMNINDESYGYNNRSGRGLLDLPRKHPLSAAKNPGSGFYNHQSLRYQNLQAIHFQQLKQQQLMKHHRQLMQSRANSNKNGGSVDLSSSAWSHHPQRRDGSVMRAVFLGDHTGKRGSTGTGVFLPRRVNHTPPATAETREKSTLSTVLVPARVAQVLNLNLDESVVKPVVRSPASLNDVSWRQRSNNGGFSSQMKMEQPVSEPRLPLDWAY